MPSYLDFFGKTPLLSRTGVDADILLRLDDGNGTCNILVRYQKPVGIIEMIRRWCRDALQMEGTLACNAMPSRYHFSGRHQQNT